MQLWGERGSNHVPCDPKKIDPREKGKPSETESSPSHCVKLNKTSAGLHLLWFTSLGGVLQRPSANETTL